MRRGLRIAARALLTLAVVLLLAPLVVPPFLDRVYYRGPVTDHFDGAHFRNPEGELRPAGARPRSALGWMLRAATGRSDRVAWPDRVAVNPTRPPRRVAEPGAMLVTWVGHATVLVQTAGLNILTDPIWSERASPFAFAGPKRVRAPGVRFEDLPRIDVVLVSHNHYDHMDLDTLRRLEARDRPLIVTSLGNDAVLRNHGVTGAVARDWGGSVPVRPGVAVIVERVHHWGSRWGADRNRALWSGFTVVLPGGNLFFAGDTGWGDGGWVRDAARHGPFRLALIPIGAFSPPALMSGNHIGPTEAARVFAGLGAAYALGVHWGTFRLSDEGIDEPPRLLAATLARAGVASGRFRTTEAGATWAVPPLSRAPAASPARTGS